MLELWLKLSDRQVKQEVFEAAPATEDEDDTDMRSADDMDPDTGLPEHSPLTEDESKALRLKLSEITNSPRWKQTRITATDIDMVKAQPDGARYPETLMKAIDAAYITHLHPIVSEFMLTDSLVWKAEWWKYVDAVIAACTVHWQTTYADDAQTRDAMETRLLLAFSVLAQTYTPLMTTTAGIDLFKALDSVVDGLNWVSPPLHDVDIALDAE